MITDDITLAATLQVLGYQILEIEIIDGNRGVFHFDDDKINPEHLTAFDCDALCISPKQFIYRLRTLKSAINGIIYRRRE